MKTLISTLAATAALAMAAPASADPFRVNVTIGAPVYQGYGVRHAPMHRHPLTGLQEINMRQARQRERIEMGFHNGSITRWEFRRLMTEQHHIEYAKRAFVADGFLTDHERFDLNRRLDFARQSIRWEATDFERRF